MTARSLSLETHHDGCLMRFYMRVYGKLAVQSNRRRVTVTRNGSVKTPRTVDVAVDYEDVVRGVSRDARLKLHGCEALGQSTVSVSIVNEFTEVISPE